MWGEGRGYTDEHRKLHQTQLATFRFAAHGADTLFEGDALVDALPTLTDMYHIPIPLPGHIEIATPGVAKAAGARDATRNRQAQCPGRLNALDRIGRQSPSTIGFAFHTHLLLGGFAGEPEPARRP